MMKVSVPDEALPYVKDLLDRKLGPGKHKRGPNTPLWNAGLIERAARAMGDMIKKEGLSEEAAADRVREEWPLFEQFTQEQLIRQYGGRSGHGDRWLKRRP